MWGIDAMARRGLRVFTHDVFTAIERYDGGLVAHTYKGERLEADAVMLAIGRWPNTAGLGLENAGVKTGAHGRIEVDAYSRTTAENIYAVGDVTDRLALTPVAIHEAMCFVKTVFENAPMRPDHALVPTAVFSTPEIGTVGLTEVGALELGHAIDVYKSTFRPLRDTLFGEGDRTMMKLLVDQADDHLLGAHLFGPDAAEMAQLLAVAMKMGAKKSDLDSTVALHPSAAEELVTMRTKAYSRP
jgi:glutathione reductase (NADPH)